ncbi:fibrillarin-like rRNA/tRNA 2'-O-methyltransferase [archaeon]|nr:fibrillarin-like rRNA/tRNA 2'-O-methyltransferase [archaeon]
MKELFLGVFARGNRIFTASIAKGTSVYGERLVKVGENEYREWDPFRSKLGAAIVKGIKKLPVKRDSRVLYLGAAQGTTASHIADIVGPDGVVFCIEFAPRAFEKLLPVCRARENMVPLLADAGAPEKYAEEIGKVDLVYQDVAQPNQADIFVRNCRLLLQTGGIAVIVVKARSVDVTDSPANVFEKELETVRKSGLKQLESIRLEPFEKDHMLAVFKKT